MIWLLWLQKLFERLFSSQQLHIIFSLINKVPVLFFLNMGFDKIFIILRQLRIFIYLFGCIFEHEYQITARPTHISHTRTCWNSLHPPLIIGQSLACTASRSQQGGGMKQEISGFFNQQQPNDILWLLYFIKWFPPRNAPSVRLLRKGISAKPTARPLSIASPTPLCLHASLGSYWTDTQRSLNWSGINPFLSLSMSLLPFYRPTPRVPFHTSCCSCHQVEWFCMSGFMMQQVLNDQHISGLVFSAKTIKTGQSEHLLVGLLFLECVINTNAKV